MTTKPRSRQDIRKTWGVSLRTVQSWVAYVYPVDDDAALAEVLLKKVGTHPRIRAVARSLRGQVADESFQQRETVPNLSVVNRSLADELLEVSAWIARAEDRMSAADRNQNEVEFEKWDKVRRNYSDQKVKNLLAQSRLGIDSGVFIGKAEIERIFSAFAGRAAVSIARMRDAIAPKLVGMKDAAEAGRVIYDATWRAGYVKPFVHAKEQATFFGLPAWVVEALTTGFMDLVDDSEPAAP